MCSEGEKRIQKAVNSKKEVTGKCGNDCRTCAERIAAVIKNINTAYHHSDTTTSKDTTNDQQSIDSDH